MGCKGSLSHPGTLQRGPTTGLKRHSEGCRSLSTLPASEKRYSVKALLQSKADSSLQLIRKGAVLKSTVLNMIASSNSAFRLANNQFLQLLCASIPVADARLPISRKTIRKALEEGAILAKQDLKKTLSSITSKVSLALDCWSSRNGFAFLGMLLTLCSVQIERFRL